MEQHNKCSKCAKVLEVVWAYCPYCGASVKPKSLDTSYWKQILIYLISFFFAPFGLAWGIKYLINNNRKARIIGIVSIFLTVVALAFTIYATAQMMDTYSKMMDGLVKGKYPY